MLALEEYPVESYPVKSLKIKFVKKVKCSTFLTHLDKYVKLNFQSAPTWCLFGQIRFRFCVAD